jgi:hypothetical protein
VRAQERAQRARERRLARESQPRVYGDAGAAFTLGLSLDAIFHDDVGFRRFDGRETSARIGVFAGYDVLTLAPRVVLSGELGVGFENQRGDRRLDGNGRMELRTQTFYGALSLRWDATSFLAPQLRASGGASLLDLELALDGGDERDHAVSGFGALGLGVLLHTPARLFESRSGKLASLKFGVLIEGGYALRSPADFSLRGGGDARGIEVVNARLGRLELSGPYLRGALVVRF